MPKKKLSRLVTLLSAPALLAAASAHGAGFALIEQSVSGLGNGFAGGAAIAEDASTIFFNPAGMTRLGDTEYLIGMHVVYPTTEYKSSGNSSIAFTPSNIPLRGGDGGEAGETGVVPNFYYVRRLNPDMVFGLGVNVPFGLATDYEEGWEGRYHALRSEVMTVNINPSLAWKVNEQLSLGAGVNVQYVEVPELSNALDYAQICNGLATRHPNATVRASAATCTGAPTSRDGRLELDGDDWSFGFNLGLLYEVNDGTRFGVAYRSRVDHELEGSARFTGTPTGLSNLGIFVNDDVTADLTLPESLSVSAYHELNSRWAIMGDITWTRWEQFDELRVEFDTNPQDDLVTPEEWDNTFRYSLGLSYRYNDRWTLRTGVAYDETAIPSAELRTPRIPGNDRRWVAFGASYRHSDRLHFDVGYAHLFIDDTPINNTNATNATLVGEYESSVDILSAQVRWQFD